MEKNKAQVAKHTTPDAAHASLTPNILYDNMQILKTLFLVLFLPALAFAQPATEAAFSPNQGSTALIVRTIEEAHKSIRVAAYTFTSHTIAEALVNAHHRGVDVKVVLNG